MGLLGDALVSQRARKASTNPRNPAYWLTRLMGGEPTATGLQVGDREALRVSAIFGGVRMIAEDIGGLPLPVLQPDPGRPKASVDAREHGAWDLLNWRPNPEMTALDFRGALTGHAVLRGGGYAEKQLDASLRTVALWPLRPDRMRPVRNGVDVTLDNVEKGAIRYLYTLPSGEIKVFHPDLIFHLPGFGYDGLIGYSIVALMREGIALSLAAEEHGARFYGNDATPGVALKHPGVLGDVGRKNLEDSWRKQHEGLSNAHRLAILEEGMDIAKVGMDLADAQYIETRKFQIEEFARALRLPLSKLSVTEGRTWNNGEQEDIAYVKALLPWGNRWEQRLRFHGVVREPYYTKHRYAALVKGDLKARGDFYHWMRQDGVFTTNTILSLEDMPLSDDPTADMPLIPVNMQPAAAYDDHGHTLAQKADAASRLARAGWTGESIVAFLQTDDISRLVHSGLVPTSVYDPDEAKGDGAAAGAASDDTEDVSA